MSTKVTGKSEVEYLLSNIVGALIDKKASDVLSIDLRNISNAFVDYFVICHAESTTKITAMADNVGRVVKQEMKLNPFSIEGKENAQWVVLDYGSIVLHCFLKEKRTLYDLESLWSDGVSVFYN